MYRLFLLPLISLCVSGRSIVKRQVPSASAYAGPGGAIAGGNPMYGSFGGGFGGLGAGIGGLGGGMGIGMPGGYGMGMGMPGGGIGMGMPGGYGIGMGMPGSGMGMGMPGGYGMNPMYGGAGGFGPGLNFMANPGASGIGFPGTSV